MAKVQKLYIKFGEPSSNKILVVANLANVNIEAVALDDKKLKDAEFLKKNPSGRLPLLENEHGTLSESNAIVKYIASLAPNANLEGTSDWEKAKVQSWLDWNNFELEPPLNQVLLTVYGHIEQKENAVLGKAAGEWLHSLKILNGHLATQTFLVGNSITVADIAIASSSVSSFKFLLEDSYKKLLPHVFRWFTFVSSQDAFVKAWGKVRLCTKAALKFDKDGCKDKEKGEKKEKGGDKIEEKKEKPGKEEKSKEKASKAAKQEKGEAKPEKVKDTVPKKIQEKKEKKDDEDDDKDEDVFEKKEKNPLDSLPPSSFNFFDYKTLFVNAKDKKEATKFFFDNFDKNGYSIYHVQYQKDESVGKVLFLTNNLMKSPIQKLEDFRKYAFAVVGVYGDEPNLEIRGVWVWRGVGIPERVKEELDLYNLTPLDISKEGDRHKIEDYWTHLAEDEDTVDGLKLRTCVYFK